MRRLCRGHTVFTVSFLCLFFWLLSQLGDTDHLNNDVLRQTHAASEEARCPPELEHLRSLRLTDKVVYSRRCIKPVVSSTIDRDEVKNISEPLFKGSQTIDVSSCDGAVVEPCDPLTLEVPPPYPERTYPELTFGIVTTTKRLRDSLGPISHWLSGSSAKLVVLASDRHPVSDGELHDLQALFAGRGIDATVLNPPLPSLTTSQNHFAIVRDLLRLSGPETSWLGILDDDTFFPSLYPLVSELSRHDASKPQYVGALSEDFRAVRNWGYMAFGGAGIFLSIPAARALDAHLEECLQGTEKGQGDGIIRDCVHRFTHTKLSNVHGLHQQDIRGDVSGFFEAGLAPVSLHHWKSWYKHPVDKIALISWFCGDCFLQRWRIGANTVLSNGYSVSVYPEGLEGLELEKMEETWGDAGGAFDFSLGPLRPKLPNGAKRSYQLVHAEEVSPGVVRQVYVLKGNSRNHEPDEVAELLWDFNT